MITAYVAAWAAFVAAMTFLVGAQADLLGRSLGLLDAPNERKLHARVTPLMGGVALCAAVLPAIFALVHAFGDEWVMIILLCVVATALMALVGMADDRHALSVNARLAIGILTFTSLAASQPAFAIRTVAFHELAYVIDINHLYVSVIFTVICCVGLVNAVNMADGKNGLVISLLIGWLVFILVRAPFPIAAMCILLVICLSVLLFYNLKGRLFLGDGGTYGFTTAVALLVMATYNSPGPYLGHGVPAEQIVCLFAVPVLDSFRLTYSRLRAGRSPMSPDRDHLHHHLQDALGWPRGLFAYLLLALAPAGLTLAFGLPTLLLFFVAAVSYGGVLLVSRKPELRRG